MNKRSKGRVWKSALAVGMAAIGAMTMHCSGGEFRAQAAHDTGVRISMCETAGYTTEITQNPETAEGRIGGYAKFTVKAGGWRPMYQWQYRGPEDDRWQNCKGLSARTSTLVVNNLKAEYDGYCFRCVVTDPWSGTKAISDEAELICYLELNEKNFPDELFREEVRRQADFSWNGRLEGREILGVTSLYMVNDYDAPEEVKMTSLKGIEYFTNVDQIWCGFHALTQLDVSRNTKLRYLSVYGNKLTKLDVSKNTGLLELDVRNNELTKLDVRKNTALTKLWCGENKLKTLDVRSNRKLEVLSCADNQIRSVDVSRNTNLKELDTAFNNMVTLDLRANSKLETLYCFGNKLTTISFSSKSALRELYCYDNELKALDLSKQTRLENISCYNNKLTKIDVRRNTNLIWLDCSWNEIGTLDVSNNTALTDLLCTYCGLSELDLSNNVNLHVLFAYGNMISELDLSDCPEIWQLEIDSEVVVTGIR